MPQIPIIIPLIVLGLVVGSTIKSRNPKISRKKLAFSSLAAGLLNSLYAYLLYLLAPAQIPASFTGVSTALSTAQGGTAATSEASFVIASFLTALLMVLLVLGVAMAYARVRGGGELEEATEAASEEEEALLAKSAPEVS